MVILFPFHIKRKSFLYPTDTQSQQRSSSFASNHLKGTIFLLQYLSSTFAMPSLFEKLIKAGEISDKCLRCHQQLKSCDLFAACEILTALEYQQIHDLDYQDNLQKLAEHSFCHSCATKHPKKVKSYRLELANCPTDDFDAATVTAAGHGSTPSPSSGSTPSSTASSTPGSTSGSKSGSDKSQETRTESQKRKARRTCAAKDLEELARKVKQMEHDTDGFKKRISVLKQELQT